MHHTKKRKKEAIITIILGLVVFILLFLGYLTFTAPDKKLLQKFSGNPVNVHELPGQYSSSIEFDIDGVTFYFDSDFCYEIGKEAIMSSKFVEILAIPEKMNIIKDRFSVWEMSTNGKTIMDYEQEAKDTKHDGKIFLVFSFLGLIFAIWGLCCLIFGKRVSISRREVNPVHREITIAKTVTEIREIITSKLQFLKGRIVRSDETNIECDFGSLLKSRLLGEFWVSKSTLPKKSSIELKEVENGSTVIILDVRDTNEYVDKWGLVKKYEKSLEELADSILSVLE
ncbi:hypothetical protein HOB87_09775 [Candidatus Woesearchaeota archaeon]|jgi:hypothetical protein|nr:hypothetical protein [Candidatus Woesearchaeota archaeon]